MEGHLEHFRIGETSCGVWLPPGEGPFPFGVLCGQDPEELPSLAVPGVALLAPAACWERDFTPWPAPGLPGRAPFSGGAEGYLSFLLEELLPQAEGRFPLKKEPDSAALMGYSLAGLFAFWAAFRTERFGKAASLSGSLWYEGLEEFWEKETPRCSRLYLSLGKGESRSGPVRMRQVEDCTRKAAASLTRRMGEGRVTLEWNRGGHFTGVPNRWRKALLWAARGFEE